MLLFIELIRLTNCLKMGWSLRPKNSSLFLLKLCIPQEIFLNLCEARAGKFLITIEWFGIMAHKFLSLGNLLLPNFWYDRIPKKCFHGLNSGWSKPGVNHYKTENFVSLNLDSIMTNLGQLIDFDQRKNLQ